VEVVVPDLGDFADVEVIEVLVKPGDSVAAEQGLITLETDKATMDIPSPAAGKVTAVKVKTGDRVSAGSVIATLESADAPKAAAAPAAADPRPEEDRTVRQPKLAPSAARAEPAAPRVVTVPDLGDFSGVEIIDVLVKPGDEVTAEQGVVTLETEKVSMDVPAPEAGKVLELKVAEIRHDDGLRRGRRTGGRAARRRRRARRARRLRRPRRTAVRGRRGRLRRLAAGGGLERQNHVARRHAIADLHVELADAARGRRRHVHRGFLGLERDEALLGGDLVARLDEDLDDLYVGKITKIGYDDVHLSGLSKQA
jgi:biotin carboxyl carrier protein